MTHRPPTCHYDPTHGGRVTNEHRDDCPTPATHAGCAPCTAPHCVLCHRRHTNNDHPLTCPTCIGAVHSDLAQIPALHAALAHEATHSPAASARIPGGNATILRAPGVPIDPTVLAHTTHPDHRPGDPLPPLAVLAYWEDHVRAWLGHDTNRGATIDNTSAYLIAQIPHLAQTCDGPDWLQLSRDIQHTRANLERALHDETTPDRGVPCFECGDQLVRRHYQPTPCKHPTPARQELGRWLRLGYPEAVPVGLVREARRPCAACDQGGLALGVGDPGRDPARGTSGVAWECPGCRKHYDPGEYATAVRRDLLQNGAEGDGWTHVAMAAEAASTLTGGLVLPGTVRKWMERGRVASCCLWSPGERWGVRLVYWPDVAETAVQAVRLSGTRGRITSETIQR